MKKQRWIALSILAIFVLVLAACGGGEEGPTAVPEPAATEAPAPEPTEAPVEEPVEEPADAPAMESTGLEHLDRANAGEFADSVVTLLGVMTEEDGIKMEKAVEPFEDATGIDVQYTGTKEFEALINTQVDAGN
ncbi:MAG: hypothetical protein GY759_12235, partial [Chloroflexi bacterium]|nr:hypothetical protein [Chloroflexota bacterium]